MQCAVEFALHSGSQASTEVTNCRAHLLTLHLLPRTCTGASCCMCVPASLPVSPLVCPLPSVYVCLVYHSAWRTMQPTFFRQRPARCGGSWQRRVLTWRLIGQKLRLLGLLDSQRQVGGPCVCGLLLLLFRVCHVSRGVVGYPMSTCVWVGMPCSRVVERVCVGQWAHLDS